MFPFLLQKNACVDWLPASATPAAIGRLQSVERLEWTRKNGKTDINRHKWIKKLQL